MYICSVAELLGESLKIFNLHFLFYKMTWTSQWPLSPEDLLEVVLGSGNDVCLVHIVFLVAERVLDREESS